MISGDTLRMSKLTPGGPSSRRRPSRLPGGGPGLSGNGPGGPRKYGSK